MKDLGCKLGLVLIFVLMSANIAPAAVWWSNIGTGDWSVGANWDVGVPGTTDNAYVNNGGTAVVTDAQSVNTANAGHTGSGTIQINSGGSMTTVSSVNMGRNDGANGTITVNGGTLSVGSNIYTSFDAGEVGSGTLTVTNGGTVTVATSLYLGYSAGDGTLNVDGSGSIFTVAAEDIIAGRSASTGSINITGGGVVGNGDDVYLGNTSTSTGAATVDGSGSEWNIGDLFYVGNNGVGTLAITGGGAVSNSGTAYLGYTPTSTGTATVDGAGSTWNGGGSLHIGKEGAGALTITDGATVGAANVYMGYETDSEGASTVAGHDSVLHSAYSFYVGRAGAAALYITNSGLVSVDGFVKINSDESGEECFIRMTSGGMLAVNAADITGDTLADFMDRVQGTDDIQYLAGSEWVNISHGIEGLNYTLATYTGSGITYRRLTVLTSPAFRLGSPFSDNMVLQQQSNAAIWGWADPGSTITVSPSWTAAVVAVADGNGEWRATVPTPAGSTTQRTLSVADNQGHSVTLTNLLIGEVWLCSGQSNMQWYLEDSDHGAAAISSANPNIRLFTVPHKISSEPLRSCGGTWRVADTNSLPEFSAVAYYFGRELQQELGVPIGLINSSFGGTRAEAWTPLKAMARDTRLYPILDREVTVDKHEPASLYHAMINPLDPYAISGVIWYQGESNRALYDEYRTLFPTLIKSWRYQWGQGDFPFYFVQLAPLTLDGEPIMKIPLLQEAQLYTLQTVLNTGMAVTTDIGNIADVHPTNKLDVGKRLSYWALANTYGQAVLFSGPIYREVVVEGSQARILFDYDDGGLTSIGPLDDFTIAGSDMVFYPASAVIESNSVVVSSASVTEPVAVRYCWKNEAEGNLYNVDANLPASPFRTDNDELYDTSSVAPAAVFKFGL